MKTIAKLAMALAVASACASVSAAVMTTGTIDFESFMPGIYTNGDTLVQDTARITVHGQNVFDGALVNGRDPSSCDVAVCPAGNGTNYYAALNDGGFSFDLSGSQFGLASIDFGFILPVDALVGFSVGKLIATANDGTTASQDFGMQDGNGDYRFTRWNFGNDFNQVRFTEVSFSACLYDGNGDCVNPAMYQAQFAVDNLTYVPEPGSLPLMALSMGGMLLAYRRRKSA
jgi:hypothetical protein